MPHHKPAAIVPTLVAVLLALPTGGCGSYGRAPSAPQEGAAGQTAGNNGVLARGGVVAANNGAGSTVPGGAGASAGDAGAMPAASASAAARRVGTTPGGARTVAIENGLIEFHYSYPAAAGGIPALQAVLDRRADAAHATLQREARADRSRAQDDGVPYSTHSSGTYWKVVARLPDWLSLSADTDSYSGGAHGSPGFDALLWDRRAQTARRPVDLFRSDAALSRAVQGDWCAAIDRQRERKRGEPVQRGPDAAPFGTCPDPVASSTIILGSSDGRGFDKVGFLVPPYNVGPYAEGSYEVTLPVTPAILAAVQPPYRAAFAAGG